jgi:sugar O-acyltransferase (sialic acid O-acetyltransferase NeuD family)
MVVSFSGYARYGKRVFDLVSAFLALAILSPVLLAVACIVWSRLGWPILFRQIRPGLNGKPFVLYKFRTMREATYAPGRALTDAERLTPFGSWLRSTSLDELPELWNVLVGDMSLVGPRPLLMQYLDRYTPEQMRRHDVRPGLTGLAQIKGRNSLSWKERFDLDLRYVREHTFFMDLKILFGTIVKVLSRDGIASEGCATGAPFEPELPVVVVGAGGHGKIIVSILQACGTSVDAVYDDDETLWGRSLLGVPIKGPIDQLRVIGRRRGVLAIGDNKVRAALADAVDVRWIAAIHPTAIIHTSARILPGAVVCAGAVIQPDCRLGRHTIVNTGATLDHDCEVGDFASIGPGTSLAGSVRVSPQAMIGTGCVVLPGVRIGACARIGAGSTVARDVAEGITVCGVPARPVQNESPLLPTVSWPVFDDEQIAAVERVLRSGRVNYWTGLECRRFEEEYAAAIGVKHAIAVANGTVALELSLASLGIGPGDEVIVPSRTFIASASAAAMRGAIPVVADVDPNSQTLTAETIEAVITPRTRAIVAVHLGGWPCDMDPILELASRRGLFVIEDCAQAHGATYRGRPVGSMGHVNAFSFCQDKILTTGGEGGMLTTNDTDAWERAWSLKDHGKNRELANATSSDGSYRFLHDSFGTNLRMTEMQAAIGRIQLARLPDWVNRRRSNAATIVAGLADIPGIRFPEPPPHVCHSYYRLYGFIDRDALNPGWTRDEIIRVACKQSAPIGSGSCGEIYREKAFSGVMRISCLPVASCLHETSLAFPVHPSLDNRAINSMTAVVRRVLENALGENCMAGRSAQPFAA